jgi:D-alanyl-D-alanine-carboxypeptidase/D-alanyl-D-alanine-endopeptidase
VRKTSSSLGGACRIIRGAAIAAAAITNFTWSGIQAAQADPLLDEIVEFTGGILYYEYKVPALVIGVVRDGEISVRGFGERAGEGSKAPDGDTLMRIGSITKAFTGEVLAHLAATNRVQLTQPLTKSWPELAIDAKADVGHIRLIDLSPMRGLPREVPHEPGPENDPFSPITLQAFSDWLKGTLALRRGGPCSTRISALTCSLTAYPRRRPSLTYAS